MSGKDSVKISHPVPNTVVVIVCGTFVAQWYADRVYGPLAQLARKRGYPVRILAIPHLGLGSMEEALEEMLRTLVTDYPDTTTRFILVGHSQGGSHIMGLEKRLNGRVYKAFPISAPTHGTWLANLGNPFHFLPKSFRDMAHRSPVLRALRQTEVGLEELSEAEVICIMTLFDTLVIPSVASLVKGAENVVLAPKALHPLLIRLGLRRSKGIELVDGTTGHLHIVKHPAVLGRFEHEFDLLEAVGA